MSVSFNNISKQFFKNSINIYLNGEPKTLFNDVKSLASNQNIFFKDIIYVGNASTFEKLITNFKENTFVLINDNKMCCTDFTAYGLNIIELKSSEDIFEIFNKTSELFKEDTIENQNTSVLLKSAFSGKGIDGIIEVAASLLNNPLIFVEPPNKKSIGVCIQNIKIQISNLKSLKVTTPNSPKTMKIPEFKGFSLYQRQREDNQNMR